MKRFLTISLIIGFFLISTGFLLDRFLFKSHLDESPVITDIKLDEFEWRSSKAFFYSFDNRLYYSGSGKIEEKAKPIWAYQPEKVYVSPNGKLALIYRDKTITLINSKGNVLFEIDDCTGLYTVEDARKSERFLSTDIQWLSNSEGFLISQDRVWDKIRSEKNKTSIFQYSIEKNQLTPLVHLNEECKGDFYLSSDDLNLYYKFATDEGDLAFKKVSIKNSEVVSEHLKGDSLRLKGINPNDLFINYNDYKSTFQSNSHDRSKIVVESWGNLYFDNKDTTVLLLKGERGNNAFKGIPYGYSSNGYFLPGNRYFTTIISSENVNGTLVVDTKTFKMMLLNEVYEFYFNVNNTDCEEFEFRYSIVPKVRFATSVSNELRYK